VEGQGPLDLFGGSGSTLMAAGQTGRRAHLMEPDPLYGDVIALCGRKFTGRNPGKVATASAEVPA